MFVCLFLIHRRKRVKSKYFFKNMSIIFLLKKVVQVVWISIIVQILYSNEKKINFPICISAPSWKGANRLFFKTVHGFIKSILITVTLFFFSIYFGSEKKRKNHFIWFRLTIFVHKAIFEFLFWQLKLGVLSVTE